MTNIFVNYKTYHFYILDFIFSWILLGSYGCHSQETKKQCDVELADTASIIDTTTPLKNSFDAHSKDTLWLWYAKGHIKGHNEKDTIVGNFTGKSIDTLYITVATKRECYYYPEKDSTICTFFLRGKRVSEQTYENHLYYTDSAYDVLSTNKNIPRLPFQSDHPLLNYEGDLDGDGIDEIGIGSIWGSGNCRYYYVFTLVNNKWRLFIEPFGTSYEVRASGVDLVTSIGSKDSVKIHYADLRYGCDAPMRDSIVTVTKGDFLCE